MPVPARSGAPYRDPMANTSDGWRSSGRWGRWGTAASVVPVVLTAFVLGALTAYAQGWLPSQVSSLANSRGSWSLVAFLLAMRASGPVVAAAAGSLSLLALLAGYVVAAGARDHPSSTGLLVFWGTAAVLVGPLLGIGGFWVRTLRGPLCALGAGAMSGVLVGEGVYGLTYVADTTYPPYWWGSIAVGVALLLLVAALRLPGPGERALAAGTCALAASSFVAAYSQGSLLLPLLA